MRRSIPRPKHAIHVFRKFDAQLLVKLRADGVTTFVHVNTKMPEGEAEWLKRNSNSQI
jgi:hypothetical protein